LIFEHTSLEGVLKIALEKKEDERGFFARSYCSKEWKAQGLHTEFVQLNTSYNRQAGTLRGLHFQYPPQTEIKMVRCMVGAIYDVVVDIRPNSPQFGCWEAFELSASNRNLLYIPQGYAHGFQTLVDDTELLYFHHREYEPGYEGGVHYLDPALHIQWPLLITAVSQQDQQWPMLNELSSNVDFNEL
jgi:dTDP-4-dehydrorhamnose 3,5-epimerase